VLPSTRLSQLPYNFGLSRNRTPGHSYQDTGFHALYQRYCTMGRLGPSLNAPALLSPDPPLFEISELPHVKDFT